MGDQKMKGRTVSLMIMVLIFQVLSASLHGCFAAVVQSVAPPSPENRSTVHPTVTGQSLAPPSPRKRSTVHPTAVNGFRSSVLLPVSGNVYPVGHYTVTLGIGNPPKNFQLDIDTGSVLTWVQCDAPCTGCTLPPGLLYKPVPGSFVPCKDPNCAALRSLKGPQCKNPNDKCSFHVEYADHVSVDGVLVSDSFPLRLVNGTLSQPLLAFGCGYRLQNHGPYPTPSTAGVLGLGRSKASISSQLSSMGIIQNVSGHCLGGQGGFLFLGADFVPKQGTTWTPMLQNPNDNYYSSGPAQLLFGGKPTGIKGLNVIFDTGSSYTYLSSNAYETLLNLIRKDLSGKQLEEVKDPALPICWKGARPFKSIRDARNYFNIVALTFTGSSSTQAQLQLPPESYLIITERGNVCLGILNGAEVGLGTTNVIGDISLQDKLVIYDNENQRIGWVSANCNSKLHAL